MIIGDKVDVCYQENVFMQEITWKEGECMNKDFWNMSWNPVWGCLNTCPYCYARRIAKRYAAQIAEKEVIYLLQFGQLNVNECIAELTKQLESFKPIWLESNYVRKFPKKPSIIFVNSMSDPAYWEESWYKRIVKRIAENMQHTFVVLTKLPVTYKEYIFPHNTILGVTINTYYDYRNHAVQIDNMQDFKNKLLLSIEPIQNTFSYRFIEMVEEKFDWIHVGQESGNRKDRIKATREMIQPFFDLDIPVFMKNNLDGIIPGRKLRKEFPDLF